MGIRRALIASMLALAVSAAPAGAATAPYTVRFGDTLTWIARAHHTTLLRLAALNHLAPYGILQAGSVIRVPVARPARPHHRAAHHARHHRGRVRTRLIVVRRGQSLWSIAAATGTTPRRLAALNHRPLNAILPIGLRLRVPARTPVRHAAAHSRHRAAAHRRTPSGPVPTLLRFWALRFHIDPRLILAVSWQESGWQPGLRSSTGAVGLMQVMPGTWSFVEAALLHRRVAHTESGNVRVGVAYLAHLLHDFGGNVELAVAGYYQGEAAVRLYGLLAPTRIYVADVLALRGRM